MAKKYLVVARNTRTAENGLVTGKGHLSFHGKTAKIIDDPTLVSEIETQYGKHGTGDVWTHEDPIYSHTNTYHDGEWKDGRRVTHGYFFGSSKKYRREWDRIFKKKVKDA